MAYIGTHERDCMILFKKPYTEVHKWLDHYAKIFPPKVFDTYHRTFRHHGEGLAYLLRHFGPLQYKAGILHILRDFTHIAETNKSLNLFIETGWYKLNSKNLFEALKEHHKHYGAFDEFYADDEAIFLVDGKFMPIPTIKQLYPELHKEIRIL